MGRGLLHVAERHPRIESSGNERVAQCVRADRLGEPGPAGDTPYDPAGAVTIEAVAADRDEDWAAGAFADG
jgi:hypothetical protein